MLAAVRLLALSHPVIEGCPDAQSLLSYCARVSNEANQTKYETAADLLSYLIRHKHWSPFEMVSMTLVIETTRDIARQILRHRSFSFQEFSQRYAEVLATPIFREVRLQDKKNRQNSLPSEDEALAHWWQTEQADAYCKIAAIYREALDRGVAKEVARAVLPEGMTPSRLYMAGTIRSWIHYCQLRTQPETQKEHRAIAQACKAILLEQFPALALALPDTVPLHVVKA